MRCVFLLNSNMNTFNEATPNYANFAMCIDQGCNFRRLGAFVH
jgi:hypothetical protein